MLIQGDKGAMLKNLKPTTSVPISIFDIIHYLSLFYILRLM